MRLFIILLFCFCNSVTADTNQVILSQGKTILTYQDLDGFALRLPADKRAGFFQSVERIDKTLRTMLTMKHVVNYAQANNQLDGKTIDKIVQQRLFALYAGSTQTTRTMQQEIDYNKIKDYFILEESYKFFKQKLLGSVDGQPLEQLAKEKYLVNNEKYTTPASKNLDYIAVVYNKDNKQQQYKKALLIASELKNHNFAEYIAKKLSSDATDIETKLGLEGYIYNKNYKEFSNFIFSTDKLGVIDGVLDYNGRFNIVNILQYYPKRQLSYDEVKQSIVNGLIKQAKQLKFNNLVLSLTEDPINIDKKIFAIIQNRYIQN